MSEIGYNLVGRLDHLERIDATIQAAVKESAMKPSKREYERKRKNQENVK